MNSIHRTCSYGLIAEAKSSPVKIGHLAFAEALRIPDDWESGWVLSWVGRRCSIMEDIQSGKATNMAGHMCLITNKSEVVAYLPDLECSEVASVDHFNKVFAKKVVSKDRTW
eukprot:CAMPEP_0195282836 /NCGR_PEP_ID=MMETSP0707-20130614/1583_1 /TAXON_ID=33640 /ORGANISM="Asterionellopsis glacialis, Strain CCMP134" /LENGTH=111 /DNA_ID=CAMNT_0040341891 /DNA_START=85 /DNA_END=417 /DNA_ORIENTATION=+